MPKGKRTAFRRRVGAVLAVLCALMAALLLCAGILLRAELTAQNDRLNELRAELSEAREESTRLRIEYESLFDLAELEEYAKNVLGMKKPDSEQIIKTEISAGDR